MIKKTGFAILAAVWLGTASVAAQAASWADLVAEDGWTKADADDEMVTLFRRANPPISPDGYVRIWWRSELHTADTVQQATGYRGLSMVLLEETDCKSSRYRIIQTVVYEGHNMEGSTQTVNSDTAWSYAIPGSRGDMMDNIACGSR